MCRPRNLKFCVVSTWAYTSTAAFFHFFKTQIMWIKYYIVLVNIVKKMSCSDLFYVVVESPHVKVSPDVIRESSSVKISCETPAVPNVNQCYFYINREEKNIKHSFRCELDLSGAEVFRWASVKSPGPLNIYCYYTIHGTDKPSPHSPPATVMVQGEKCSCC